MIKFILSLTLLCSTSALAHIYVVSPNGSDSNNGDSEAPFKTINHAARIMQAGDRCIVKAGDYFETVNPAASGTESQPVIYQAAAGERVVIWGTEPLTEWRDEGGGIWSAPMNWTLLKNNQIFMEGKMAHEARWPNRSSDDLLDPQGALITGGSDTSIICDKIPEAWTDDCVNGAIIWCMAGKAWTSWTTPVTGYEAGTKTIQFEIKQHSSVLKHMNPGSNRKSHFYISGIRIALDAPGEWFYDEKAQRIFIIPPTGKSPDEISITAKKRMNAFELNSRDFITIEGFEMTGATLSLQNSNHCLIKNIKASYVSHTRGGNTSYSLGETTGVYINGNHNLLRNSEISWSAGDGVMLSGKRNALINSDIHHTDYLGAYGCTVKTSGSEHLISYCSIHDTGRDCVQAGGQANIVEHCDIYHMGRMAHDLGGTYNCGSDGGGTEFRYNLVHDNLSEGLPMGIYLDNFTKNYFIHHNLCWNIKGDSIRLNKPSTWCVVVNNTMLGFSDNWGRWKSDWMYGSLYANNLASSHIKEHVQVKRVANLTSLDKKVLNVDNMKTATAGLDQGIVIDGITDGFKGAAPDIGAFESGLPPWKAGHDFANPPSPAYQLTETILRNIVDNGCFEHAEGGNFVAPWKTLGKAQVKAVYGAGGISESYTGRVSIIGHSVEISKGAGGITQELTGLKNGFEYDLACWVKSTDGASVELRLQGANNAVKSVAASKEWQMMNLRFKADANLKSVVVEIFKDDSGTAYIDEVGCVGLVPEIGIGPPGFAD